MPTPIVNGINYSWANVTTILFGVPLVGIMGIKYKRKVEKKNNYGAGQQPVSRGYGNYEYDGELELYMDTYQGIIAQAPNNDPLLIPFFDIIVLFAGQGVEVKKHVLRACEFTDDEIDTKSGDTKIMVKVPLIIGGIDK